MLTTLTVLTPPTVRRLIAPETAERRLGLTDGDLDTLAEQIDEASGLVEKYLGYATAYAPDYVETFSGPTGARLYLGARPAWSITSATDNGGNVLDPELYRLSRGANGESLVVRRGPWVVDVVSYLGSPWPVGGMGISPIPFQIGGTAGVTAAPEWTLQYAAGWWLEEMGPTPPDGVATFPAELRRDFLAILRWLRGTDSLLPNIYEMKNEGASVTFLHRKDQVLDALTGIPTDLLLSLTKYRRPT